MSSRKTRRTLLFYRVVVLTDSQPDTLDGPSSFGKRVVLCPHSPLLSRFSSKCNCLPLRRANARRAPRASITYVHAACCNHLVFRLAGRRPWRMVGVGFGWRSPLRDSLVSLFALCRAITLRCIQTLILPIRLA